MTACYAKDNELYYGISNRIIKHPAILIEPEIDNILKYGEFDTLLSYQEELYKKHVTCPPMIIRLAGLNANQQAFVINHMINRMQKGFIKTFVKKNMSNSNDFFSWLKEEMQKYSY